MSLIDLVFVMLVLLSVFFAIFIIILFIGVRGFQKESLLDEMTKKTRSEIRLWPENLMECTDTLFNWQIRNFMEYPEFDKIKSTIHERYKKQMTELEYARFVYYLINDDLQKVDIGIRGLDGFANSHAIPKLEEFIEENKDKKEFKELVERAKTVRDRIINRNK